MAKNYDYDWVHWQNLTEAQKKFIYNHYWDAYNPEVGCKTKVEIVDNFIKTMAFQARQYGVRSFGWNVYMLFVVVDNSKQRVPKYFAGLPINKGIIVEQIDDNNFKVKFNYGGISYINISQSVLIG